MNGFRTAIAIDGERYLDGGVVARVTLSMVGEGYDELWVSAASPHGIADLRRELERWRGTSRLVVVTPSAPLPVGRWTMSWPRLEAAIDLGAHDMATAARAAVRPGSGHVVVGRHADQLRAALDAAVR